jgi:hypothetical protein
VSNLRITKYLKLPFQFEEKLLLRDLETAQTNLWIPHFNKGGYEGEWKSIALYAKDGDEKNIYAMSDGDASLKETKLMNWCSYFREVVHTFKFPLASVRLLKLGIGAEIKPHRDYKLGYEDNYFRLHVPITTNDEVEFILDEKRLIMKPGECWYTNVNYIHSVANRGKTDRVHLVIDGERNQWSDELFFSLAPKESFEPETEENYSPEMIKELIKNLEFRNEPAAEELIKKYRKQLKNFT